MNGGQTPWFGDGDSPVIHGLHQVLRSLTQYQAQSQGVFDRMNDRLQVSQDAERLAGELEHQIQGPALAKSAQITLSSALILFLERQAFDEPLQTSVWQSGEPLGQDDARRVVDFLKRCSQGSSSFISMDNLKLQQLMTHYNGAITWMTNLQSMHAEQLKSILQRIS